MLKVVSDSGARERGNVETAASASVAPRSSAEDADA